MQGLPVTDEQVAVAEQGERLYFKYLLVLILVFATASAMMMWQSHQKRIRDCVADKTRYDLTLGQESRSYVDLERECKNGGG